MTGAPLVAPRLHSPAVMLNLLGDLWFRGGSQAAVEPPWDRVLALPGAHLHLYGKRDARPGRKMGHLTLTAASAAAADAAAREAAALLGIAALVSERCGSTVVMPPPWPMPRQRLAAGELRGLSHRDRLRPRRPGRRRRGGREDLRRQGPADRPSADRPRRRPRRGASASASISPLAERLVDGVLAGPGDGDRPPRVAGVAEAAAAGQATIGLRCPAHPIAHALLAAARDAGVPGVAAPSANRFGRISPTTAAHVVEEFGDGPAGARRRCGAARHRVGDRRLLARPAGAAAPGGADPGAARGGARRAAARRRRAPRRAPRAPWNRTTRRAPSCA